MAKMRSTALICCNSIIFGLSLRAAEATGTTKLPPQKSNQSAFSGDLGLWRVFLALAIVIGLILLIKWVVSKVKVGKTQSSMGGGGKGIVIVERKTLGPRHALLLVRVGNKKEVLLHQSKGDLTALCEIEMNQEGETK